MAEVRAKLHRLPLAAYQGEKAVSFTCCLRDRKRGFVNAEIVNPLVQMLSEAANKYHCIVPVYCFMPDHLHAVLRGTSPQANAKTAIDAFKSNSGLWLCQNAPFCEWQLNYHDHVLRKSEDFRNHVRYVARNPIRAGLVHEMTEYPFLGSIGCDLSEVLFDVEESERFGRFQ